MSSQIWKPIDGYLGFYEVSDRGMVRSVNRAVSVLNGKTRKITGRTIAPKRHSQGYRFVALSKGGAINNRYIHRLVAAAFISNPMRLPLVNHLSGDKTDNRVANLQWVTHAENVQHAYDNGLNCNKGAAHHFAAGVIDNVLGKRFSTVKDWCAARGIPYSTGRNLLNGSNKSKTIDLSGVVKNIKTNV
jgi:hypothetical protein